MKNIIIIVMLGIGIYLQGCGQTNVSPNGGGGATGSLSFSGIVSASKAELGATNEVLVTWNAATSESRVTYYVYHSTAVNQVFSTTASSTSGVASYNIRLLDPDTLYFFGVRASNEAGSFETNTITQVATTGVVSGSMKYCYPWDLVRDPKYQLIGIKAYLSPNTSGVVDTDKIGNPQYWYYVFNVNSTKEVYKSTIGTAPVKVDSNDPQYNDITMNFDLNNIITLNKFIGGLDSFALMKIVNHDPTMEAWITTHPDYNTKGLVIINYGISSMEQVHNIVLWISNLIDASSEPGKGIYIDTATGAVKQYD